MRLDNQANVIEKAFGHVRNGKKFMQKLERPQPEIDQRIKEASESYQVPEKVLKRLIYV